MKKALCLMLSLCVGKQLYAASMSKYVLNIFAKKTVTATVPKVRSLYLADNLDFKQVIKDLVAAGKDPEIAGIILFIDNNGGDTGSFSVLHDLIKKIADMKPMVSLIGSSALSGGYWVSTAADYLIAHSCSDIGSIGVYSSVTKLKKPKQIVDVEAEMEVELFIAGEFKALWHQYGKDLSEKQRTYIQSHVDTIYKKFLDIVVENRRLDLSNSKEWAEGKCFIAEQALSLGLIDEIGTVFEAEKKILELIKLKNPTVVYADDITLIE